MTAEFIGLLLCLIVGAACRFFGIPLPAPERFVGAFVLLAMTLGFVAADAFIPHGQTLLPLVPR